jgi:hypothetical protein
MWQFAPIGRRCVIPLAEADIYILTDWNTPNAEIRRERVHFVSGGEWRGASGKSEKKLNGLIFTLVCLLFGKHK